MKLKTHLGILTGRISQYLLSKRGGGSTLPGKLALTFDPHVLDSLAKDYDIIVITGTNGKTLTTALTVSVLQEAYDAVVTNPSGANMITGIVATFLKAKKGKRPIAVLEIDEASLARVCDYITPSLFVLTNIFRDQMDRYGEIYTTYQMILEGVKKAPEASLLLNGDSPLFHTQIEALPNPVFYYGFATKEHKPQPAHYNTEGVVCPKCHRILSYKLNTYANLGDYLCLHCDFKRPKLTYQLTALLKQTTKQSAFTIDGSNYQINVGGLYNIYNALAAVAISRHLGLDADTIKKGFDKSRAVFGRQEQFTIGTTTCTLILIKNPVGATQALELIKLAKKPFSLSVLLNANYADGIDTSWIWDAHFEAITDMPITHVTAGGVRASEMARRLRVTGIDEHLIQETTQLEEVFYHIKEQDTKQAYILATYTAMLEFRELLASHKAVKKEMR